MDKLSFIRHGDKLKSGQERGPIGESNLNAEQQRRWEETCAKLNIVDPEVTYESALKMEALAADIYESLPERALVVFTSTNYPRTRFTAEYILETIENIAQARKDKKIYTETIGESNIVDNARTVGTSTVAKEAPGMIERMKAIMAQDASDDNRLTDYFSHSGGGKGHAQETEIFFRAVNADLASDDSVIQKRAAELRNELQSIKDSVQTKHDLPIFIYGVGHMSSLIALDVAFSGRTSYEAVEEMPTPLSLREVQI